MKFRSKTIPIASARISPTLRCLLAMSERNQIHAYWQSRIDLHQAELERTSGELGKADEVAELRASIERAVETRNQNVAQAQKAIREFAMEAGVPREAALADRFSVDATTASIEFDVAVREKSKSRDRSHALIKK